jgi:hypothetical protein
MKRILKWTVPVDDKTHPIGAGPVVHVGAQGNALEELQVWTEEQVPFTLVGEEPQFDTVLARVYGTGHEYPDEGVAVGTVFAPMGLVWHLVAFPKWNA